MKELTYLHCQNIRLSDIGNNFYCYLKKHENSPTIFLILDHQHEKHEMIEAIEKLKADAKIMPIIVTDVKDKTMRDKLNSLSEGRMFIVQRSGFTMSAMLCVLPLQRLAYDLTLALGYHPDRPRNLAKELTT